MWEFYRWVRDYVRAVRAGDVARVKRIVRKHRILLEEEETLLAPIYFGKPDVAQFIVGKLLRKFRNRKFYHHGLYGLIHWFGEADVKELERDVLRCLQHRRENMRYTALNTLTLHWRTAKHRRVYEQMLLKDPATEVRSMAASGLGYVLTGTRDRRASRVLARKVMDPSEDHYVREPAYEALRKIWLPRRRRMKEDREYWPQLHDKFWRDPEAWEQWIDRDFVAALERGKVPPGFTTTATRGRRRPRDAR